MKYKEVKKILKDYSPENPKYVVVKTILRENLDPNKEPDWPGNFYALIEGKKYEVLGSRYIMWSGTSQKEYLVSDNVSQAWYPSDIFYSLDDFRQNQLEELGI